MQETQIQSLAWEDPLKKVMATSPVFLPGKSHEQRTLEGYSPRSHKELDATEHTHDKFLVNSYKKYKVCV